ncbi:MAG: NAD(P)H-dependent oxidoreductase [Erysipelotrichaceae bacterium]|nr:NAD(P)H-dependent oxidoreductase [Erysipelotrichaceae bacterium]
MKTAIVFYSQSGNVRWAAQQMAEILKADLIELECVKQYPDKGFKKFYWGGKSAVMQETPKLQPYVFNGEEYDRIILGSPVWASNIAPPLRTFIKENQEALVEKKTAAFVCMSGSGGQKALNKLEKLVTLCAQLVLIDPLERPSRDNDALIRDFCARV